MGSSDHGMLYLSSRIHKYKCQKGPFGDSPGVPKNSPGYTKKQKYKAKQKFKNHFCDTDAWNYENIGDSQRSLGICLWFKRENNAMIISSLINFHSFINLKNIEYLLYAKYRVKPFHKNG